jgi:acetylornithine deacetylase/succinyl-diaminopimelate desuccinylase-like protein
MTRSSVSRWAWAVLHERLARSRDSPVFLELARSIRAEIPGAIVVPYLVPGATDSRHYYRVSEHVYRFAPILYDRSQPFLAHEVNERITLENLTRAVRFHMSQIRASAGRSPRSLGSGPLGAALRNEP